MCSRAAMGARRKGVALVDPDGSPRDFGDEPLLIARKLEVSGGHRRRPLCRGQIRRGKLRSTIAPAGRWLPASRLGARLRYRAGQRDRRGRFVCFRMGRLREPLSALARADAIVLTNDAPADGLPLTHQKVWRVQRDIVAPQVDEPCLAFCGIARPGYFFAQLRAAGMNIAATRTFRDHHAYTKSDVRALLSARKKAGSDVLCHHRERRDQPGSLSARTRASACGARLHANRRCQHRGQDRVGGNCSAEFHACMRESKVALSTNS